MATPQPSTRSASFPVSQRELVGLALSRGARPVTTLDAPCEQRDRVRLALALGVGAPPATRAERRGIYR